MTGLVPTTPMLVAMGPIFQGQMPGAQGYQHPIIRGAGHFLQQDAGEELAGHIADFIPPAG
jgi:haloalkane dehalogenase